MKNLRKFWFNCLAILGGGLMLAHAGSTSTQTSTSAPEASANSELTAELQTIEQQPTISPASLPPHLGATYFFAQHPEWPPAPTDGLNLPLWSLGDNVFVLDDLGIDYTNIEATTAATAKIATINRSGGAKPQVLGGAMPYLTIAPSGTNQLLITVINTNTATYYLQSTPALANTSYPWTTITNGMQTNFVVNIGPYADSFFRVFIATNSPGQGVIAVFIDSPTNGATIQ
jgi:hypothetical protein